MTRNTLQQRRLIVMVRRLMAACCAGLAVWLTLQFVAALVSRESVVVASADIARGERLSDENLAVLDVPASSMSELAAQSIDRLRGRIALAPIIRGQPVYESSLSAAPIPPAGSTTIEVRLASLPERLIAGDHVDLVSSVGCAHASQSSEPGRMPQSSDPAEPSDAAKPSAETGQSVCVLASDALTVAAPIAPYGADAENAQSDDVGLLGQSSEEHAGLQVTVALDPDEALAVLAQQEAGPLLAVSRGSGGDADTSDE